MPDGHLCFTLPHQSFRAAQQWPQLLQIAVELCNAMRRLAREIAPPQDRAEALRAAQKELAKMAEDQKELVQKTEKAAGEKDFDKWVDKRDAQGGRSRGRKK